MHFKDRKQPGQSPNSNLTFPLMPTLPILGVLLISYLFQSTLYLNDKRDLIYFYTTILFTFNNIQHTTLGQQHYDNKE